MPRGALLVSSNGSQQTAAATAASAAARRGRLAARLESGRKLCRRCGAVKPLGEFGPNRTTSDLVQSWCRPCVRGFARGSRRRERAAARAAWPACPRCGQQKPPADFASRVKGSPHGGPFKWCRSCRAADQARKKFLASLPRDGRRAAIAAERDRLEEEHWTREHQDLLSAIRYRPPGRIEFGEFPCCAGEHTPDGARLQHSRTCAIRVRVARDTSRSVPRTR